MGTPKPGKERALKLDTVENALRLKAGILIAASAVTVLQGLRRSSQRPVEREGGRMLTLLHQPPALAAASAAAVGLGVALWRPLPLRLSTPARAAASVVGSAMLFSGLALFHWGRRTMGQMYDLSTSQGARLYADHRLVTSGPFAYVRHPLYVAGTLAEIGALLLYRNWTTVLITLNVLSLVKRAAVEEEALAARFGDEWIRYTERVPRWLPRWARG
jgi:protein-S-isoprenylcysteine O-methyltransferase Ste14